MSNKQIKTGNAVIFLIISVVLTTYLAYIDEGYYSFQWMKSFGNWMMFFVYITIIFLIQFGNSFVWHLSPLCILRFWSYILGTHNR